MDELSPVPWNKLPSTLVVRLDTPLRHFRAKTATGGATLDAVGAAALERM